MRTKPNSAPLSPTTGQLYLLYMELNKLLINLQEVCTWLNKTQPWADKKEQNVK